jgi:hypothetical protein
MRPGAKRIATIRYTDKLETTAFKNTNGTIAAVVMNRTDHGSDRSRSVRLFLYAKFNFQKPD